MIPDRPPNPAAAGERPFVLRLHKTEAGPTGRFVPAATVEITPFLRASGLLAFLPAEEVKTLLLLLTFVTSNGDIHPTLTELAYALRLSSRTMQQRMRQLAQTSWQGAPLVQELRRDNGLHAWTPSPPLLTTLSAQPGQIAPLQTSFVPVTGREAIVAQTRSLYTRPRQEVEEDIARRNGWNFPFPQVSGVDASQSELNLTADTMNPQDLRPDAWEVRSRLLAFGLKALQTDMLLARFDTERIRRQLDWLPARNARNPAAFLLAAIEKDYDPPPGYEPPSPTPEQP